jgi:hypothetical protein
MRIPENLIIFGDSPLKKKCFIFSEILSMSFFVKKTVIDNMQKAK